MCIQSNEAQIFHQLWFFDNESEDRIKKKLLHKLSNLDETDQLLEIEKLSKETTEQSNSY